MLNVDRKLVNKLYLLDIKIGKATYVSDVCVCVCARAYDILIHV